jgi:putative hydrolase of the HAD superfamily
MIKTILFDCDGVIVKERTKYFRQRMEEEFGMKINSENDSKFFKGNFLLCETGKLDLKEELAKELPLWNIDWSVEKVMDYWFAGEAEKDERMVTAIKKLRERGVKCYLSTNNEKYRVEYLSNQVGLTSLLDGIFSSASLGYLKPDINFWEEIYKQIGGLKSEVLVFDNQEHMTDSARQYGFNSELYIGYEGFEKQLSKYHLSL